MVLKKNAHNRFRNIMENDLEWSVCTRKSVKLALQQLVLGGGLICEVGNYIIIGTLL